MSGSRSTPRASMPASRSSARNSPRPQPRSSTGRSVAEVVDVGSLPLPDRLGRAAHPALEGEVVRDARRCCLRRGCRGGRGGRPLAPLQPRQAFLQLDGEPRLPGDRVDAALQPLEHRPDPLLRRRLRRVPALRDRVDETKDSRVEAPLVGGERLDVPAHELAQRRLDGRQREPAQPPPRSRPRKERPFGAHRPERLGLAPAKLEPVGAGSLGQVAVPPLDLVAQPREYRLELSLLDVQAVLRHVAIVGTVCRRPRVSPASPRRHGAGSRAGPAAARARVFCSDSREITVE